MSMQKLQKNKVAKRRSSAKPTVGRTEACQVANFVSKGGKQKTRICDASTLRCYHAKRGNWLARIFDDSAVLCPNILFLLGHYIFGSLHYFAGSRGRCFAVFGMMSSAAYSFICFLYNRHHSFHYSYFLSDGHLL